MPPINKDHALAIVKKLGAVVDTSPKAHDVACVYHNGALIASVGIRRGSNRNQGHGQIPKDLHLSPRQTLLLAQCPLSVEEWPGILRDKGWIEDDDPSNPESSSKDDERT